MTIEHDNWVRYYCLEQDCKRHPYARPEKILDEAAQFANFVLQTKPAAVLEITKKGDAD